MTVDDEWVEERTEGLRLKAYDQGHMDDISGRHELVIDAHHHFWDLERNYYPWLRDEPLAEGRHGDYRAIRRDYLPEDFRTDWDGLRVIGSVHVEAHPSDPVEETRWVSSLADRTGLPTVIVALAWLDQDDVEEVLAGHAQFERVRGVRAKPAVASHPNEVVPYAPGSMSDPAWQQGYAKLEGFGFSFDLQAPFWHLPEARALAERFPGITIILDHTGLPNMRTPEGLAAWRKCMQTLAERRTRRSRSRGSESRSSRSGPSVPTGRWCWRPSTSSVWTAACSRATIRWIASTRRTGPSCAASSR